MDMMDVSYGLVGLGAGMLLAGTAVGGVVRYRLKSIYEKKLAAVASEKALLEQQLEAKTETAVDLRAQLDRSQEQVYQYQTHTTDLNAANAALETRLQQIPALEKELAETKKHLAALQNELRQESAALAQALEKGNRLTPLEDQITRKEEQVQALQEELAAVKTRSAELSVALKDERRQGDEKIAMLRDARDQLKIEFQNLAQRIFEEKSLRFIDQNRTHIDQLLSPLRDQMADFKKRVDDVYDKESRDRTALQTEIRHLKELNQRISKEALNLARALKGDSKVRGNWGEVILERVLEASGLQKGREYDVQVSMRDRSGRPFQPDVVVRLPQGKDVVVDAKVSLKDYEAYYSAEDHRKKQTFLKLHIDSIRSHIRTLAAKNYEDLDGLNSLDYVLMFIPIEAAFQAAVEKDGGLFSEAFDKNIVIVSPSTLLVTLRTIENIWRNDYQNRYALEIAKKSGALYDKFVGFVEALEEVGQQLDRAKSAYQTASHRLVSGRGNLIRRTQELKKLGVKAAKELPRELLEAAQMDDS